MDSRQTGFVDSSSHFSPSYATHSHAPPLSDDFKASYDDLIDEYAAPYGAKSSPDTYSFSTSTSGEHRRRPSQPLAHKPTFLTKTSDDDESYVSHMYPPAPLPKETEQSGFWSRLLPDSMACRLYLLTVLLETAIDVAIEAELYIRLRHKDNNAENAIPNLDRTAVYLVIFALAHVFQFVLAVDAVHARNTLQFIFLTIFNALFLLYAIFQIGEIKDLAKLLAETTGSDSTISVNALTTIIPIVISIAEAAYIGLGWKIYNEFGWKVYKFLGADRRIKKMYASYQVFECLVKFDVFFWVGFSVQFIWLVLNKEDWEYYVTCAALPLSVVLLVEGHLAARHENKWMMATFMSGCVSAMIYFIYKLAKVLVQRDSKTYKPIYQTLTLFSVLSICLLVATFVFSVIVMRNFGRGLKGALEKRSQLKGTPNTHNKAASVTLNRMSIN
jgi:hypothetical protein